MNPTPASAGATGGGPLRRRVLVVDDNVDSAEATCVLLKLAGHEARSTYLGVSAIAVAHEMAPEVVLLDLVLPDMSGREVARALRGEPRTAGALIIAVTGYGREEDVRKSREAGIDAHLTKPVDTDQLLELVARGRADHGP